MLDRRYALTATLDMRLTRVRRTATTGPTGLSAECSSGPDLGMDTMAVAGVDAITAVATGVVVVIGVVVAGAMVAQATVRATAEAMVTVAVPMAAAQPTPV